MAQSPGVEREGDATASRGLFCKPRLVKTARNRRCRRTACVTHDAIRCTTATTGLKVNATSLDQAEFDQTEFDQTEFDQTDEWSVSRRLTDE